MSRERDPCDFLDGSVYGPYRNHQFVWMLRGSDVGTVLK
jgi:hypothetical protein